MNKLTYPQAYSKIIDAYFKDEIKPLDCKFCFCGTLSHNSFWFVKGMNEGGSYPYSIEEYSKMERALFDGMYSEGINDLRRVYHPNYEQAVFTGLRDALEVLKEIHRDRGEDVDEVPGLTKRDLVSTVTL